MAWKLQIDRGISWLFQWRIQVIYTEIPPDGFQMPLCFFLGSCIIFLHLSKKPVSWNQISLVLVRSCKNLQNNRFAICIKLVRIYINNHWVSTIPMMYTFWPSEFKTFKPLVPVVNDHPKLCGKKNLCQWFQSTTSFPFHGTYRNRCSTTNSVVATTIIGRIALLLYLLYGYVGMSETWWTLYRRVSLRKMDTLTRHLCRSPNLALHPYIYMYNLYIYVW